MTEAVDFLPVVRELHARIRDAVVAACERSAPEHLSGVAADDDGDTIYAIDRVSEEVLIEAFEREVAARAAVVLIAEGLPGGRLVLPRGLDEDAARWRVIVDPIDGTRGLMYQKRSAWALTGVARNRGEATSLRDIELAVQTELPLVKQHLCDVAWAVRGRGADAARVNRLTGAESPLRLRPSRATDLAHGFASLARFFPGARDELAAIDDDIAFAALQTAGPGKALVFEDQYISSGGQLYEMMAGHDRFVADVRPLMRDVLAARGRPPGLCSHPYDVCTELIARELGVVVTDERGRPLDVALAVEPDVSWVAYANPGLRAHVEPLLQRALRRRGFLA
jgi:fructose-1,6-bisphosphatase/inositol monophosphatase family enzyme